MKLKILLSALVLSLSTAAGAYACTGFYVGKDVSADGSVMIARTEDMTSSNSKRFIIHPAKDHAEGTYYTDAHGLKVKNPAHTYRYSALPGSASRHIGEAPFGAAGFNELGVAATSTITAYPNEKVLSLDPFTENGLYELSANDLILSRASTAREGIKIIAAIVDEHGSGEGNIIMVADKNEAWYMEILSGHQYAAIKLPNDMAAVIPNAYMLGEFDITSEDVIYSKDLVNLPKTNGFLKQTNGKINIRETYSEPKKDSNTIRIWGGLRKLHGVTGDDPYKTEYELLFKPTKKISVKDVMDATRYRYEDTEYNVNLPENKYVRAIGTSRQEESHILQIRQNMPIESSCIQWLCIGNAEFAPYVPYYAAAMTDTPLMYKLDAPTYNEYSMYWASRSLSTISALNRDAYGSKIQAFFSEYENKLIANISKTDSKMSLSTDKTAAANKLANDIADDYFSKTRETFRQLMLYLAEFEGRDEFENNTYEFKIDISPEISATPVYTLAPVITVE